MLVAASWAQAPRGSVAGRFLMRRPEQHRDLDRRRLQDLADRLPPLSDSELGDARAVWGHQVQLGHRMPAEPGVVLIRGDWP